MTVLRDDAWVYFGEYALFCEASVSSVGDVIIFRADPRTAVGATERPTRRVHFRVTLIEQAWPPGPPGADDPVWTVAALSHHVIDYGRDGRLPLKLVE